MNPIMKEIKNIYIPTYSSDGSWNFITMLNYLIMSPIIDFTPLIIILIWLYICIVYIIKIEGSTIENWEKDMCSPKYVFFSGFFKNNGDPFGDSIKNFETCVLRYRDKT